MNLIMQLPRRPVLLRVLGLVLGLLAAGRINSYVTARRDVGGADIGLFLILAVAVGLFVVVWGAVDGARSARRGVLREQGQWSWGVAAFLSALVGALVHTGVSLFVDPDDGASLASSMAPVLIDFVLFVISGTAFMGVAAIGPFRVIYDRVARQQVRD
ncbi:hypothetical protein OG218_00920 [Kineococcus sp. NBC_00420]|uniref:hypothetical protein n=1 Tax=Kineococcus sp. NBC_00420 TaxID=2903564 RepID=UPI002E1C5CBA